MADAAEPLRKQVAEACERGTPLALTGAGTRPRAPFAESVAGEPLALTEHCGIVDYQPDELVVTARAGTPLVELEAELAERGQCLPFDPPRFAAGSTLGGALATGWSGPSRPWWGSLRDAVLGVRLLDGRGRVGQFGGQVMKNVAGYDVARLQAGAWGTLGVALDISLRLRPIADCVETWMLDLELDEALALMNDWQRRPAPLAGMAWHQGVLHVRLAGHAAGVAASARALGGRRLNDEFEFWQALRDLRLPWLAESSALWRLSLPADAPQPALAGDWLLDWGGAQRWCRTKTDADTVMAEARALGGHAMRWQPELAWSPLQPPLLTLHRRLKQAFDPAEILNPLVWE